jgi:hypothetical protein
MLKQTTSCGSLNCPPEIAHMIRPSDVHKSYCPEESTNHASLKQNEILLQNACLVKFEKRFSDSVDA